VTSKPSLPRAKINTSVEHAFAILRVLASSREPLGVVEIGRRLGLPTATTHRVMITLCDTEYLSQPQNGGKYEPGIRLRELLFKLYCSFPLRSAVTPILRALTGESGYATTLTVPFGYQSLRIAGVSGRQQIQRPLLIGEMHPLHVGSASLAILAYTSDDLRGAYFAAAALTSTERRAAQKQIGGIRTAGYICQIENGVRSIAYPIRDPAGHAVGSITLEGSVLQLSDPTARELKRWNGLMARAERDIAARPEIGRGPFDHLSPGNIAFRSAT
jgi:DNA-binding IclR family transcriptional regulator